MDFQRERPPEIDERVMAVGGDARGKHLGGTLQPTSPVNRAQQYDWDRVTEQAEIAYHRAIDGTW